MKPNARGRTGLPTVCSFLGVHESVDR
jgi:hypothetical protein